MLLLLLANVATAQQTCYYAAGVQAASSVVPCGSGSGVVSCCQIGDFCLEDSACWNENADLTYLYGCTDPTYTDASCPWKCGPDFDDVPYVGLTPCRNTTNHDWTCTRPPNNGSAIVGYNPTACRGDSIIAFAGPNSLAPILSLPTNVGGSTVFFSEINPTSYHAATGWTPSTIPTPDASKPISVEYVSFSPTSTQISVASPVATSGSSSETASSALSSGVKIGLGVGLGVGGALIIGAVVVGFLILRRRRAAYRKPFELPVAESSPSEKQLMKGSAAELASEGRGSDTAELPAGGLSLGPVELAHASSKHTPQTSSPGSHKVHELPGDDL